MSRQRIATAALCLLMTCAFMLLALMGSSRRTEFDLMSGRERTQLVTPFGVVSSRTRQTWISEAIGFEDGNPSGDEWILESESRIRGSTQSAYALELSLLKILGDEIQACGIPTEYTAEFAAAYLASMHDQDHDQRVDRLSSQHLLVISESRTQVRKERLQSMIRNWNSP